MTVIDLKTNHSIWQTARSLSHSPSGITRVFLWNWFENRYDALLGHQKAEIKRHKARAVKKLDNCCHLDFCVIAKYVIAKLDWYWSSQKINSRLKQTFPMTGGYVSHISSTCDHEDLLAIKHPEKIYTQELRNMFHYFMGAVLRLEPEFTRFR